MPGLLRYNSPTKSRGSGFRVPIMLVIMLSIITLYCALKFMLSSDSNINIRGFEVRRFSNAREKSQLGLKPIKFRSRSCQCIKRQGFGVQCLGSGPDYLGTFDVFLPAESYDLNDDGTININYKEDALSSAEALLLNGKFSNGSKPSTQEVACPSGNKNNNATGSTVAFIQAVKPQIMRGIYHSFLASMLPHISFILGVCNGTVSVKNFDPITVDRWVINHGTWRDEDPLLPIMTRVWDAIRPQLRQTCGNSQATFELWRSNRDEKQNGKDPYPPKAFENWEAAQLFVYLNSPYYGIEVTFFTMHPSHAKVIRQAVLQETQKHLSVNMPRLDLHHLKVAVIDRLEEKGRNIVYNINRTSAGGGHELLKDTAAYLNCSKAPNGKSYVVSQMYYTNDFASEGIHQIDILKDVDLVLWPHGAQQTNVLWLPECAIAVDLLGTRNYVNMYDVAGVQTGHIYGYVYSLVGIEAMDPDLGSNHAGLSSWPTNYGSALWSAFRHNPVHVNFTSITNILPHLLELRWKCLNQGFKELTVSNLTRQHLEFATGNMGDAGSPYY